MEWVIWVIVIVLIIAIVWWLMSRGNTQDTSGRVEHRSAVPPADSVAKVPDQAPLATGGIAPTAAAVGTAGVGMAGFTSTAAAAQAAEGSGPTKPDEETEASDASASEETAELAPTPEDAFIAEQLATADEPGPAGAAGGDVDDWEDSTAAGGTAVGEAQAEAPAEDGGVTADDILPADPGPALGTPALGTPGLGSTAAAGKSPEDVAADKAEWEATWSEASAAAPAAYASPTHPIADAHPTADVHHHEYTGEHAPTLPGAESAAAESLAADASADGQPYGEGSAAAGPDGSGPEGYTVKADATAMTYYEEDSPAYAEATAEVWFISAAHAEAAGFRPPRRNRH